MAARNPEERRRIGSYGAHIQWSREVDRTRRTAKARQAFLDKFDAEIATKHPDVDPAIRAKMAEHARKAYFIKMAHDREQARKATREAGGADA